MAGPPVGDQTVFAGMDVFIRASGTDSVDPSNVENAGIAPVEPLILVAVEAVVQINDGTSAGRVPGLRIFGDGREVQEVGSAAFSEVLSFPHRWRSPEIGRGGSAALLPPPAPPPGPSSPVHGQPMDLEFRYQGSSFSLTVEPLVVEITFPAAGQTIPSDQTLVLQWIGVAASPVRASVTPRGDRCVIVYRQVGPATFVPERDESQGDHEPPCPFEATAEWLVEVTPPPPSPFRSLRLERLSRRIQRFIVE